MNTNPTSSVMREPRASTIRADNGAKSTIPIAAGTMVVPASNVEYSSTFWRYCWPMNITPISVPNTTTPPKAATQKVRRLAIERSNNGVGA